jgi:hypothetical protein
VVAAPSLLASARDADGDTLTLVGRSQPAYGTLTVAPDGSFVYVPFDFVGRSSRADSFTFDVSDGRCGFAQGVVSLSIGEAPINGVDGNCYGSTQVQGQFAVGGPSRGGGEGVGATGVSVALCLHVSAPLRLPAP